VGYTENRPVKHLRGSSVPSCSKHFTQYKSYIKLTIHFSGDFDEATERKLNGCFSDTANKVKLKKKKKNYKCLHQCYNI